MSLVLALVGIWETESKGKSVLLFSMFFFYFD
jgi:hypothetical protein